MSGPGLGLFSPQEAPSETDGEDYIVPDKKLEGAALEIVTQNSVATLLMAVCREVTPSFDFAGEQQTCLVGTGRKGHGFAAKSDCGLDRLHDRKIVLECKPQFGGRGPREDPGTVLGQRAAGLIT